MGEENKQKAGKMTQCQKIIRHLEDYGSITQLEALKEYGIMRLASRVSQINKGSSGMKIRKEWVQGENRYGEKVYYARYFLIKKEGT